ncbi:Chalcone isomerase-like [Noviherbaspirillum humi]|uniref:Chalcone isomerase-like n=2 Tax=Noviherbaspirillum humi TaxID=1688639 RepID=A0A239CID4_9BURK|nr:Chalcone isomerase-like [Noviherbaspirillum humi]
MSAGLLRHRFCCLLLCCLPLLAAAQAAPPHVAAEIADARLSGQGEFRWLGIRLYDARLWLGPAGYRKQAPAAAKFALELRYARALKGERIAEASLDQIRKLEIGSPAQHAQWLEAMKRLFPDVGNGTRLTGVFLPGEGARFYRDGEPLGEIRDARFADAFFAIWLDPRTSAPALRTALLGEARSE